MVGLYIIAVLALGMIGVLLGPLAAALGLLTLLTIMLISGLHVLPEGKLGVVRFCGIYIRTVGPPVAWVAPGIEELVVFDARVQKVTCQIQGAHTADGIPLNFRAYIQAYFDPRRIPDREIAARLTLKLPSLETFEGIIRARVDHELRALVGSMTCEEVLTPAGRQRLEAELACRLYPYFGRLGIFPSRYGGVFLERVQLPSDLQHAINSAAMLVSIINGIGGDPEQAARLLLQLGLARNGQTRTFVALPDDIWGGRSTSQTQWIAPKEGYHSTSLQPE